MTTFDNQMQNAMNDHFAVVRVDKMIATVEAEIASDLGGMLDASARIEDRPSLDGCKALEKTQSHGLVKASKSNDGFNLMGMALGGGGLLETIADVALDSFVNRKSTRARPQDKQKLKPKNEAKIRAANNDDLGLFFQKERRVFAMEQRLLELKAFQSCKVENVRIDAKADKIYPWEDLAPKYNMKLTKDEVLAHDNETLAFQPKQSSAPKQQMSL